MASATIDHLISLIVFIAASWFFLGFSVKPFRQQSLMNATRALSTKTSDLLDTMLLNPGIPNDWGKTDASAHRVWNAGPRIYAVSAKSFFAYAVGFFNWKHS